MRSDDAQSLLPLAHALVVRSEVEYPVWVES